VRVLNGTSSAGKTSLARALQDRWDGPLLDAGLDRHLAMLPRRYMGPAWPEVFRYETAPDGTVLRVVPGPVGHRLVRGLHRAVAALAAEGHDVVVDHVLLDPDWARDLARVLRGTPTVLVGVRCEPPVLLERERVRGDRTIGQALAQLAVVHAHGGYDVEVDTAVLDVHSAADAVMAWMAGDTAPSALGALLARSRRSRPGASIVRPPE
jgi:chloramphenicol 3-O phosphotransferase